MAYRLAAVDLDGTLLCPDHSISTEVVAAVREAVEAGWLIVPATGRPPFRLDGILADLDLDGYLVVCNGAAVVRLDGTVVVEEVLSPEVTRRAAEAVLERVPGTHLAVVREGGYRLLVQPGYPELVQSYREHLRQPDELEVASVDELLSEPCVNLIVRHPDVSPHEFVALLPDLGVPEVTGMFSNHLLLELQPAGVSKASAIEKVCRAEGIDRSQVVAFGDSMNDLEVLRWAGRGVAMGNASAEVKAVADEIAPSNLEDGVAVVLRRLVAEGH